MHVFILVMQSVFKMFKKKPTEGCEIQVNVFQEMYKNLEVKDMKN